MTVAPTAQTNSHPLKSNFTFETFLPGKSNELARAAALRVAEQPGRSYNPLHIQGTTGLGKTHLLQAIAQRALQRSPDTKVRYLPAEHYVSDLIRAIRANDYAAFSDQYQALDVLLIDDIQQFVQRERTQEALLKTFDCLVGRACQVVFSSNGDYAQLDGLNSDLMSRIRGGLTVILEPPKLSLRLAILYDKARQQQVALGRATALYIAKRVDDDVRQLEGALTRVLAHSRFTGTKLSVKAAKRAL